MTDSACIKALNSVVVVALRDPRDLRSAYLVPTVSQLGAWFGDLPAGYSPVHAGDVVRTLGGPGYS